MFSAGIGESANSGNGRPPTGSGRGGAGELKAGPLSTGTPSPPSNIIRFAGIFVIYYGITPGLSPPGPPLGSTSPQPPPSPLNPPPPTSPN